MYKRNDGLTDDHILQNQFTAYLHNAVHNGRIDYLYKQNKPQRIEIMLEDMDYLMAEEKDFLCYNANKRVKHASQVCFSRTHA